MFKNIKSKTVKDFATQLDVKVNQQSSTTDPIIIADSVILKAIQEAYVDLEGNNNGNYLKDAYDKLKENLLDTGSEYFAKVRSFVQKMFRSNKNPFGIKEKVVTLVENFVNATTSTTNISQAKLLEYGRKGAKVYVNEQIHTLNDHLNAEFNKSTSETLETIFKKIFSDFYGPKLTKWNIPASIKDEILAKLDSRIEQIAKFSADAADFYYSQIQKIITWVQGKLASIWETNKSDFISQITKGIRSGEINSEVYYIIYDLMKKDITAQTKHYFSSPVQRSKVLDLVKASNIDNLDKAFPGIKKILNNHELTKDNLRFPTFIIQNTDGVPKLMPEPGGSQYLTVSTKNGLVAILHFLPVVIDDHISIWDAGNKLINGYLPKMQWGHEDPTNEYLLSKIFNFTSDQFKKFRSEDGFATELDKFINSLLNPSQTSFDFSKLNKNSKYATKLNMKDDIVIKIENDKLIFYLTLQERNKSDDKVVNSKVFRIDLDIDVESLFKTIKDKIRNIQLSGLDIQMYKEQFYTTNSSGKLVPIKALNWWGQQYLFEHTTGADKLKEVNDYISLINKYKPGYSLKTEVLLLPDESGGSVLLQNTISGPSHADLVVDGIKLLEISQLPNISDQFGDQQIFNYYFLAKQSLISITPRSPEDQPLPAIGSDIPLTYKIKIDYEYDTLQKLHDALTKLGYTYSQSKLKSFNSGGVARKGIDIRYGIVLQSLEEQNKTLSYKYSFTVPLNFIKASQEQIDQTLQSLIDQIPEEARKVPAAIQKITDEFHKGIWDEENNKYKDDVGVDDLARKSQALKEVAQQIKHLVNIRNKIEELYDGDIPGKVENVIDDPKNLGTVTEIADLVGKINSEILRSILENKDFIKKLNALNPRGVKGVIEALDKTKEVSKYTYLGIGAGLALSSLAIGGSSIYLARTRAKIKKTKTKIKTRRTMITLSAVFALLSAAASAAMIVLFFVNKGGF